MGKLASASLLAISIATIGYARSKVVASTAAVKAASDVFALPSPGVLNALSLGYRSALADYLFSSTMVAYGTHGEEHRRFEFIGQYLDSIVGLDPYFCQTYKYADTFIVYQPTGNPSPDEVRHVRRLLEKGLQMCSTDGNLWMSAGQFMAYIGTQFLTDEKEKEEFRTAGARTLARAAELETGNHNVQWQALSAATLFSREGNRDAAIAFLERVYGVTDSEEIRATVAAKLSMLREEERVDRRKRHADAFNEAWRKDMPFVSRTGMLVLGPRYDPSGCSGRGDAKSCPNTWVAWAESIGEANH
jgi:hypothetical protein